MKKNKCPLSFDIVYKIYDGLRVYYKFLNFGYLKSIYYLVLS